MKCPLTRFIDFGFEGDCRAGIDIHGMLYRIPFAVSVIQNRPHPVKMHRMRHHRFIDEGNPDPFAILQPDRVCIFVFHAVNRPDITLHISGQPQFNFTVCRPELIAWFLCFQICVGQEAAAILGCGNKPAAGCIERIIGLVAHSLHLGMIHALHRRMVHLLHF